MNFLVWYNPKTWGDDIGNAVANAFDSLEGLLMRGIRQLFFLLNSLIYDLIIKLYNMFETLCSARLLNASVVNAIATRIGMVLGIVMLFNVVLAFIKMLIDPDTITDKNNGAAAVIKRVLIVIVMLGVSNFVFDTLYYVQYSVINSGAISKLLLPKIPKYEDGSDITNFGGLLAEETFSAFYYVDPALVPVSGDDGEEGREKLEYCEKAVEKFRSDLVQDVPNFDMGNVCLNEYVTVQTGEDSENESEEFVINFNFLLLTAAGIGIAYFILMYCIQVGIRMIQLMLLEIIAPMAFISYLSPKQDNMFSKWYKIYLATYIDVFIRVAIINLVTMIISAMFTTEGGLDGFVFWKDLNVDIGQRSFYIIVMILALLAFAKKAPELLKELMPASASKLGLGISSPKGFLSTLAGGAVIGSAAKRAYGTAAVGFGTVQKNFRKNLGKTWDTFRDPKATSGEKAKWLARTTFGSLWSGLGGMRRGAMTTDRAGRRTATDNAFSSTQARQKLHDAGYGTSIPGLLTKKGRQGAARVVGDSVRTFFGKDAIVGDMADASDAAIQGLQHRIAEAEKIYSGDTIQKSKVKSNMYTVTNAAGENAINPATGNEYWTEAQARAAYGNAGVDIANMYGDLGKMQSRNKALNQKNEEQKSKNGK